MKIRGGELRKNIEIEAGSWEYVKIPCREGSQINIKAVEVDGDDFNVFLLGSDDIKRLPVIGDALEKIPLLGKQTIDFNTENVIWGEEKTTGVDYSYESDARTTYYLFFDNMHARSKYKSIDLNISLEHPPLEVGDEPLRESFEVDAGYLETIDIEAQRGDIIKVFGRVTSGNDINVHIICKLYETPDTLHLDKAYWSKEKLEEIDIEYHCPKSEPLLLVFDNGYSFRTTKTVDVSVQVLREKKSVPDGIQKCPFCSAKLESGMAFCPHCGGKL